MGVKICAKVSNSCNCIGEGAADFLNIMHYKKHVFLYVLFFGRAGEVQPVHFSKASLAVGLSLPAEAQARRRQAGALIPHATAVSHHTSSLNKPLACCRPSRKF